MTEQAPKWAQAWKQHPVARRGEPFGRGNGWTVPKLKHRVRFEKKTQVPYDDGTVAGLTDVYIPVSSILDLNSDFDSASNWVLCSGWSIASSKATSAGSISGSSIRQTLATVFEVGAAYEVTISISNRTAGTIQARIGGNSTGAIWQSNGVFQSRIIAAAGATAEFALISSAGFVGSVEFVYVQKEVERWANVLKYLAGEWVGGMGTRAESSTVRILTRWPIEYESDQFVYYPGMGERYKVDQFRKIDEFTCLAYAQEVERV